MMMNTVVPMTQEEFDALKLQRNEVGRWKLSADEVARAYAAGMRNFSNADLRNADLYSANLYSANLYNANLRNADLYSANLRNADLRNADLRSANLRNADLYSANLRSANLRNADLHSAHLYSANLYNANLSNADLRNADLRSANLYNANLSGANLRSANLYNANLSGANLPATVFVAQVWLPGMSSRNDYLRAYADENNDLRIVAGCFDATIEEFKRKVTDEKGKDALYLDALKPIVEAFKLWQAKQDEPAKETDNASTP